MVIASAVTKLSREELAKLPTRTGEGKQIVYTAPTGQKGGDPFVINTEEFTAQSKDISKFKRDPNVELRSLPTTAVIAETLARREEKVSEREMRAKRAGIEREEGEKTTEFIARIKEEEKAKAAEKVVPTTAEEFQRELERKQRIAATLEKQEAARIREIKQPTFIASEREITPEELVRQVMVERETPLQTELRRARELKEEIGTKGISPERVVTGLDVALGVGVTGTVEVARKGIGKVIGAVKKPEKGLV
ncbi:unnamed protein product, partial [marine sediment metagenome]